LIFPEPPLLPLLCQNCPKTTPVPVCCARTPLPLVSLPVEPLERLPHHVELGLAVPFEAGRITLPKHLRDEVIRHAASAESRGERVAQLVDRKIRHASAPQSRRPRLPEVGNVRLLRGRLWGRKQVF